ncbi:MAG: protein kinase [Labilithrix sp.]|nr:protein kinase [Labilithrix sp.]
MQTPLAFPPPPPVPRLGAHGKLAGYAFVKRLGVSATKEVVLAVARGPRSFERTVVLKRLLPGVRGPNEEEGSASLAREALAYARLAHPAIVRLFDFVEEAGQLTLVLEHVDGLSLARVVSGLRAHGADLDDTCIAYVGYRIFLALAAAHAARDPMTRELAPVVHRDVSPGNVLVPWDGYVKLGDFDVARLAGVAGDTKPGVVKGTVGYLAPEQVRGEPVSVRTDVYAACLVLRELYLREPVFARGSRSELDLLSAMAAPALVPLAALRSGIPIHVADALDRGMTPDPDRRSVRAEEMAAVMRSVIDVEAARERLVEVIAKLRRAPEAGQRATLPAAPSLFDESAPSLETDPDTSSFSQQAVTPRSPPTSMVVPRATPTPEATAPMRPPSAYPPADYSRHTPLPAPRIIGGPGASVLAPPPPPSRGSFASRTSSALIVETPNAMTTALPNPVYAPARPRRRSTLIFACAAAAVLAGGVIGGLLGLRDRAPSLALRSTTDLAAPSSSPSLAPAPAPAPAPSLAPAPAPSLAPAPAPAPSLAPAPSTGRLLTPPSASGHRIFVDGRVVGSGGAPLTVRCGKRDVRVGSAGRLRKVDVPCGGDLEVTR